MGRLEGLPEPFERRDLRGLALRPQPLLDVGEAEPGALLGAGDRAREVSVTAAPVAHRAGPHARDPRDVRRGHLYLLSHLSLASLGLIRLTRHCPQLTTIRSTRSRSSQGWLLISAQDGCLSSHSCCTVSHGRRNWRSRATPCWSSQDGVSDGLRGDEVRRGERKLARHDRPYRPRAGGHPLRRRGHLSRLPRGEGPSRSVAGRAPPRTEREAGHVPAGGAERGPRRDRDATARPWRRPSTAPWRKRSKRASACTPGRSPGSGRQWTSTWRARPATRTRISPGPRPRCRCGTTGWLREDHRSSGGRLWEMYAYGRQVRVPGRLSPGDPPPALRDLRSPAADPGAPGGTGAGELGGPEASRARAAQEAIAAYSAAFGVPSPWPRPWSKPFRPSRVARADAGSVSMVRVVQVGLADGEHHLVFEGTPAEAKRKYDADGAGQVRRAVTRGTPQPGGGCAQCKLRTACEALPPLPGILGITDPGSPAAHLVGHQRPVLRQVPGAGPPLRAAPSP